MEDLYFLCEDLNVAEACEELGGGPPSDTRPDDPSDPPVTYPPSTYCYWDPSSGEVVCP